MASTKKDETRLRLLGEARRLFVAHGFHGVSLDDIAEAAGVSRQAVYKSHFSSKADLVLELARHTHVAEKLDEIIQPAHDAKTALAKLDATIRVIVAIRVKLHDLSVVLSTAAHTDEGAKTAWQERMAGERAGVRAALELAERERRLAPGWSLDEAVDLLTVVLSTDSYHQLVIERGWSPEAVIRRAREFCEIFLVEPGC